MKDIEVTMTFGSKELYCLGFAPDEKGDLHLLGNRIIERDGKGRVIRDEILPPAVRIVYEQERTFLDIIIDFLGLN